MRRRDWLKASAVLSASALPLVGGVRRALAESARLPGSEQSFDYAWLKGHARALAQGPHRPAARPLPPSVRSLDWDQYQSIRYRPEQAMWADLRGRFRAQFFHLGLYYDAPVRLFEVVKGRASEIAYEPQMFDYGKSGLESKTLPSDMGFAGFRLSVSPDYVRDVVAFLGASYFRAVGEEKQYGISARGLAVDCGFSRPEEFPVFTSFWLERPSVGAKELWVHALLESPSVTGAYRFGIRPGATLVMDVDAAIYPRKTIERLGVAPLTSMYQYGENDRRAANDWRPEIHDSDGLALYTGKGEWAWRPLSNPVALRYNSFIDDNPRGFGLLQRDRVFDHYQDDGVFYDRRPSLWVEPRGSWGRGSIELVEIPTADETLDNIVAFFRPHDKPRAGEELLYGYRLYWGAKMPASSPLARVVATRTGLGGILGQKRRYFSWRFVVDFEGGDLPRLARSAAVEPVIDVSRGELELVSVRPLDAIRGYRAMFDLKPKGDDAGPVDMRLFLRAEGRALTETWIYQWSPPPVAERQRAVASG